MQILSIFKLPKSNKTAKVYEDVDCRSMYIVYINFTLYEM